MAKKQEDNRDIFDKALDYAAPAAGAVLGGVAGRKLARKIKFKGPEGWSQIDKGRPTRRQEQHYREIADRYAKGEDKIMVYKRSGFRGGYEDGTAGEIKKLREAANKSQALRYAGYGVTGAGVAGGGAAGYAAGQEAKKRRK